MKQAWISKTKDGDGASAPIVVNGKVYLGDRNGLVRCLDASTGGERWQGCSGRSGRNA